MATLTPEELQANTKANNLANPLYNNTITPSQLTPATPVKTVSTPTDTTNYAGITGGVSDSILNEYNNLNNQLTKQQESQNQTGTSIIDSMNALLGKTADTQAANESQGVNTETANLNKYAQQLADLNAQASSLNREAQAVPLQVQEANRNTGATDRGVAPQEAGALRLNALKALSIAQQSDIAAAATTGSQLRLQAAKDKAQQIVDLKYKPLEDAVAIKKQQYELNKDLLSSIDKKRTEALNLALKKEETDVQDAKNISLEASKNGATPEVLDAISKAKTFDAKVKAAGQFLGASQNDIVKLGNGATILVDKRTGKVIKNFGGGTVSDSSTGTPIIRTVQTSTGNVPVDGYTITAGDDPYLIAKQNGTDMETLQKINPTITDWTKIQPGAVINIPSKNVGTGSILGVTGLSSLQFNYMTQGTSALSRLSEKERLATIQSADNWAKAHGTDTATIASQYKAYNETLQQNIKRNNNSQIAEGELLGTIQNLSDTADAKDFSNLKIKNVAKLFAGEQVNDPTTLKYAIHLNQLRTELALYNAAVSGNTQVTDANTKEAERIIQNGLSSKGLVGFKDAIESSVKKMGTVLQGSVDRSSKSIWNLFGVGDQFQSQTPTSQDTFLQQFSSPSSNSDFFNQFK